MALTLRRAALSIGDVAVEADFSLPSGVVIGFTGACSRELLLLAELLGGVVPPDSGAVEGAAVRFVAASFHATDPGAIGSAVAAALASRAPILAIGPSAALLDPADRLTAHEGFSRAAREGRTVVWFSLELDALARWCDEVIVIGGGRVEDRGDPTAVIQSFRRRLAERAVAAAPPPRRLENFARRGDGRAEVVAAELVDAAGAPISRIQAGSEVAARVRVRFREAVDDPVVGVLIRNRIGVAVYGTNTELEGLRLGPAEAGRELELRFAFECRLCPQEYVLTAASHDPDGTAHDWLEEAVLFTVVGERHPAGVADLRARVEIRAVAPGFPGGIA